MPLLTGSINFQDVHSGSGLIPSFHQRLCKILVFILTLISACRRMSSGLSQSCFSCAAFVDLFRRLYINRWLLPLYYRGWITVTRRASRPAYLTVSSLSSTRQLGRSSVFVARSILQMLSPVFTGCEHPSASSSNWRSLSSELFTALHLSTCRTGCSTSLICRRRGRLRSSTFSLLDVRPSRRVTVGDRSVAAAGPRLWNSLPADVQSAPSLTNFIRNRKHIYFRNHTKTLFSRVGGLHWITAIVNYITLETIYSGLYRGNFKDHYGKLYSE